MHTAWLSTHTCLTCLAAQGSAPVCAAASCRNRKMICAGPSGLQGFSAAVTDYFISVFPPCERSTKLHATFPPAGRSSLFPIDDNLLDDGHGNQGVPGVLSSTNCYPHQNGERIERFSRKVFVGGLPPDIDEGKEDTAAQRGAVIQLDFPFSVLTIVCFLLPLHRFFVSVPSDEITSSFRRFGHLVVDWPHKAESKSYFPPKGIYQRRRSSHQACVCRHYALFLLKLLKCDESRL